jgi:hypothetical protein
VFYTYLPVSLRPIGSPPKKLGQEREKPMIRMKPIKPKKSAAQQVKEGLEKDINDKLSSVRCPVHHQRPTIKILDVTKLTYEVREPCCEKLVEEVRKVLGG